MFSSEGILRAGIRQVYLRLFGQSPDCSLVSSCLTTSQYLISMSGFTLSSMMKTPSHLYTPRISPGMAVTGFKRWVLVVITSI